MLQPENGIQIKNWYGDPADTALAELAPLLEYIVESGVSDVRKALHESKTNLLRLIAEGVDNPTRESIQLLKR